MLTVHFNEAQVESVGERKKVIQSERDRNYYKCPNCGNEYPFKAKNVIVTLSNEGIQHDLSDNEEDCRLDGCLCCGQLFKF